MEKHKKNYFCRNPKRLTDLLLETFRSVNVPFTQQLLSAKTLYLASLPIIQFIGEPKYSCVETGKINGFTLRDSVDHPTKEHILPRIEKINRQITVIFVCMVNTTL